MYIFLCKLWPYLFGGLIGWLLSGWLARRLKYREPPEEILVEKNVEIEKIIDNPEHLSLISSLKSENEAIAGLRNRIAELENRPPETIEKTVEVEKLVDNPEHISLISSLKSENEAIAGLRSRIAELENRPPETIEKTVEVEKLIDNPEHLSLINSLRSENETIGGLRSRISELENTPSEGIEKRVEVEKLVDNPEHLKKIKDLEDEINIWKKGQSIDIAAAKAAGITIRTENDFTAIEGIGPKISDLIHADDIGTFKQLSETETSHLQKLLNNAGANFQMANPGTWPDQAHLAASNRWPALKALQDILDGGVYPETSSTGISSIAIEEGHTTSSDSRSSAQVHLSEGSVTDVSLAKAAGFKIRQKDGKDDFTVVEGIGPKINILIHDAGIHSYVELASAEVAQIQTILDNGGPNFKLAQPDTWPAQSNYAAKNEWEALKKWQDELDGGKK